MNKEILKMLLEIATDDKKNITEKNNLGIEKPSIKIAILQRGWNAIGKLYKKGEYYYMEDSYVIRSWGTSKGIGQLAIEGKQENTKLDKCGLVRFHELTSIMIIDCDESKWEKEF